MFQPRKGRKTHKALNSDRFHTEWLAHQAAVEEEERVLSDEELADEICDELDALDTKSASEFVLGIIIA